MILFNDDFDALLDLLQHAVHIAGEFRFGDADSAHVLDHSLFFASLSSSASAARVESRSACAVSADSRKTRPALFISGTPAVCADIARGATFARIRNLAVALPL